jgi:hypothetical protein
MPLILGEKIPAFDWPSCCIVTTIKGGTMKVQSKLFVALIPLMGILGACGKAKEVKNELTIPGHWLMTQSEHASQVEKSIENESMVLTFQDGKAAFSPTDSVKGRAVYTVLSKCTAGPRAYHADNDQIVFEQTPDCPEKRITVQKLGDDELKFPDPDNADITRTFRRISQEKYEQLVKASDRRP